MPKVFGWQHLTFLAFVIIVMIVGIFLIKKFVKSDKVMSIVMKSLAGLLLALILWNRIAIAVHNSRWLDLIPNSFCGCASFLMAILILLCKKESSFLHFIVYLGFIGGLLTMLVPDFIGQNVSIFHSRTISGLLHHALLLYLSILLVVNGYVRPTLKKWYALPIGLCAMMTFGLFEMHALNFGSAMYITGPLLEGTIFSWWFTGILLVALAIIAEIIFDVIKTKKLKI